MVEQPRQHLPFLRHLQIHTPQAVQNTPLFVAQYQVGVTAQRLQNQSKTALLAQFVGGLDMQRHHTLQRRLFDGHNTSVADTLAQQHAEHGRLGRIVPQLLRHMDAGLVGVGAQQ